MTQKKLVRYLEILPGAITWLALIAPVILSIISPISIGVFILLFDLYWVYKALLMAYHLILGYRQMQRDIRVDWLSKLKRIKPEDYQIDFQNIYHAVILATYQEGIDILRTSVASVIESDYPRDKIIFVLATEERDHKRAMENARILKKEFELKFYRFLVTEHPDNLPDEIKAKGANVTWAAKQLSLLIRREKIDPRNVIVSTADADSRFHPKYFSALTWKYITNPSRQHSSYQPIPIFANNIWEANAMTRILSFGSTFWQLIESTRPWRLINFSTHAMSLATLEAINYWDVKVVNEDSRQFWRAYFAFAGKHHVVPIYIPVYMDAVMAENFWITIKQQYQQRLRWAYGVEHFPYVVIESINKKNIPFLDRAVKIYRLFEANFSWATASIFIAILGWLPMLLNKSFSQTVLGQNIPYFASRLLTVAWIGLIVSAWLSLKMMPPRPRRYRPDKTIAVILQWALVPISAIFFGSIPAIDAQTRLMLGKYIGFHTTKKMRIP